MPMDETLAIAAVDLSGRAAFAVDTQVRTRLVGDLQTELVTDFFEGFARGARANVHVRPCTAARTTTRSKPSSRPLRALCALPARATSSWARCCPRTKGLACRCAYTGASTTRPAISTSVLKLCAIWAQSSSHRWRSLAGRIRRAHRAARRGPFRGDGAARRDWPDARIRAAIARGVPFLGICVGMQWLYAGSTEAPAAAGPRTFRRTVHALSREHGKGSARRLELARSPQWLAACSQASSLANLSTSPIRTKARSPADTAAVTHYIEPFAAAVERGNVMGVQFHPEKSGADRVEDSAQFSRGVRGAAC